MFIAFLGLLAEIWRRVTPAPAPDPDEVESYYGVDYDGPRRVRISPWNAIDAVKRALSLLKRGNYILGTGGRDPDAKEPWTSKVVRLVKRKGSDCIGYALWCLGLDRFQPSFDIYGGWINCDSAIMDAVRGVRSQFFTEVGITELQVGDLIVFPSIDLDHDGSRDRIGHVCIVVGFRGPKFDANGNVSWANIEVAHCASRPLLGPAVRQSDAKLWQNRDYFKFKGKTYRDDRWRSRFLRYKHFTG